MDGTHDPLSSLVLNEVPRKVEQERRNYKPDQTRDDETDIRRRKKGLCQSRTRLYRTCLKVNHKTETVGEGWDKGKFRCNGR